MSTFGIPNVAPALETHLISRMAEVESLLRSHTRSEYPFVDETAHHLVAAGGNFAQQEILDALENGRAVLRNLIFQTTLRSRRAGAPAAPRSR